MGQQGRQARSGRLANKADRLGQADGPTWQAGLVRQMDQQGKQTRSDRWATKADRLGQADGPTRQAG
jgi:hypothetical protein